MKRISLLAMILALALLALAGCGKQADESDAADAGQPAALELLSGGAAAAGPQAREAVLDLTKMSGTMVYSEVYNMMMEPEDYLGRSVTMNGVFASYYDEAQDKYYFACVIQDAAECCAQGIEFVLDGDYSYPGDYPEEGEEITVSGTFDTYAEDGDMYCRLINAAMVR